MSDTQELFNVVASYLPYVIPTIFIFSVFAFSDLLISILTNIIKKAQKTIRW